MVDIFDALAASRIKFVLGRHEQGCVHMADGYARATGKPGAVLVTSGPGATNAVTGLATANVDGIPLVLVSGQVPLSQIGTDAFQEADMTGICRAVTKHSFLVKNADEIPRTTAEAFYIATHGKPGAVVIDLPRDVQLQKTSALYPERISLRAYHPETAPRQGATARLARMLNAAERPIIYAGGGVISSGAADDLDALAEKADIPVVTTLMGIGSMNAYNPRCLGMAGMYGTKEANTALREADLILALGTRFNDRMTEGGGFSGSASTVHVDCDPSSIDKNLTVDLGIVADVKDLLTIVSSRVKRMRRPEWMKRIAELKSSAKRSFAAKRKKGVIRPAAVVRSVAAATRGECIVVTDVGRHQMSAAMHYPCPKPRSFISPGGMGTMGFAIPAAIGASLSRPGERVVALAGDGGAQMTMEELIVAADEKLPVTFIVFNNSSLGMIDRMRKNAFYGTFTNPDFTQIARACGLEAALVTDPSGLDAAISAAVRSPGPSFIEIKVHEDADV